MKCNAFAPAIIPEAICCSVCEALPQIGQGHSDIPVRSQTNRPPNAKKSRLSYSSRYIRTNGYVDGKEYPNVTVINPRKRLLDYYEANKDIYGLERRGKAYPDTGMGFLDAVDEFNDSYFDENVLILVSLEEGSGSTRHLVTDVVRSDDSIEIRIKRIVPEIRTSDMAQWHIIVGIRKKDYRDTEIKVTISK